MKIAFIGARGFPVSYASAEDMVRELGPRFASDGNEFTVHCWRTNGYLSPTSGRDCHQGVKRVFHRTPGGKISGQLIVALKASFEAAFSDCDVVHYQCLNSAVFCWIPRVARKSVVVNVDGQIWKDPKWPWGIRHVYFHFAAIISLIFATRVITDSYHMSQYYRKIFKVKLPYIGYGCASSLPPELEGMEQKKTEDEYYLIMSRVTYHNLTDVMVDGFVGSGSRRHLIIAGHLPDTPWFKSLKERSEGNRVSFLGLVKDQDALSKLIAGCRAYLHGHSLGGINSALVRVVGMNKPVISIDTPFNREVVQYPNNRLQAILFENTSQSVSEAIRTFEEHEERYMSEGKSLGQKVRQTMSWDVIYQQYRKLYMDLCNHKPNPKVFIEEFQQNSKQED